MGSDAHVIVIGADDPHRSFDPGAALERACARLNELEARWSRFLPDSEVSLLNRRAGARVMVSADTAVLVQRAVAACRLTGGLVDPTVLGAVLRAGYDRTFQHLPRSVRSANSDLQMGCDGIEVLGHSVRLPLGTGFDPGGIGKGLAADIVSEQVMADGAAGVCINLGGDLRVRGEAPDGGGWTVAIERPGAQRSHVDPLGLLGVADGAVATSSTLRRRWTVGDEERHHLIDTRTGQPSDTDLVMVTVVTGTGWEAEVLAKAVLLTGSSRCFDPLDGIGPSSAQAVAVRRDGVILASPGLQAFLGDTVLPSRVADRQAPRAVRNTAGSSTRRRRPALRSARRPALRSARRRPHVRSVARTKDAPS